MTFLASASLCVALVTPYTFPPSFRATNTRIGKSFQSNKVRDLRVLGMGGGVDAKKMPCFGINALGPLESRRPLVPERMLKIKY